MKIGHRQLECRPGNVRANLDRALDGRACVADEATAVPAIPSAS